MSSKLPLLAHRLFVQSASRTSARAVGRRRADPEQGVPLTIPLREWSEASLPSWDRPKSWGAQPTRSHLL